MNEPETTVPDEILPSGTLPPLKYRDLPESIPLRRMVGPSIILAGLALGSGEFVIWPYITYKSQFVFFWACVIGVMTQYFLNMEVTRWSLATGESAITGFIRVNKHFAWMFLLLNIIPWMIPAWSTGAAQLLTWLFREPELQANASGVYEIANQIDITWLAIGGMFVCGAILTAGPVIYETVERTQMILVGLVMILIVILACWMVRPDAITAMVTSTATLGAPDFFPPPSAELDAMMLLGALAFAGAGGTTNLGQSNYIKDKGYGMGAHVGRITSPITGQTEAIAETGYFFRDTEENASRWSAWWRAASWEHFFSFFLTCMVCLVLLTLICYSVFYGPDGVPQEGVEQYGGKMNFILGQAHQVDAQIGGAAKTVFLIMGIVILLTTEFGVLDVAARISTDIVKVAWLRKNSQWSESRLYYCFLWGSILLGSGILLLKKFGVDVGAFQLFKLTAAMNGGVMFLYSSILLYVNRCRLPSNVRMSVTRMCIMIWAVFFFGFFALWTAWSTVASLFG